MTELRLACQWLKMCEMYLSVIRLVTDYKKISCFVNLGSCPHCSTPDIMQPYGLIH
jgi:hypothetical protein